MVTPKVNYFIDAIMFIFFIIVAFTGLILFFFLPGGVPRGGYQEFLGITKGTWIGVHDWSGVLLVMFVVIHLVLHWKWVKNMTKNIFMKKRVKYV